MCEINKKGVRYLQIWNEIQLDNNNSNITLKKTVKRTTFVDTIQVSFDRWK